MIVAGGAMLSRVDSFTTQLLDGCGMLWWILSQDPLEYLEDVGLEDGDEISALVQKATIASTGTLGSSFVGFHCIQPDAMES